MRRRQGRRRGRTSRPARSTCSGYAPERVDAPRRGARRASWPRPEHPYARLGGADAVARRSTGSAQLDGGRSARTATRRPRARTSCCRRPSARAGRRALVPADDGRGRPARGAPMLDRRLARAARTSTPRCLADNLAARPACRRGRSVIERARRRPPGGRLARRARPRVRGPRVARRDRAVELARAARRRGERVGFPAVPRRSSDAHGVWSDLQEQLGRPVFEIPTLPPSVPGMRVCRTLTRAPARAPAGGSCWARRPSARVRDGTARRGGPRDAPRRAPGRLPRRRWIVLATGGVRERRHRARLALARARDRRSACRCRRAGAGRAALRAPTTSTSSRWPGPGVAVDDGLRPVGARRRAPCLDNVLVAGAIAGRRAALAGEVGRRHQPGERATVAAELILGGEPMTDVLFDALMRDSLDHCVKCTICETALPGLQRDAAVPRAEVRRPAGRALPHRRGRSPDASLDYCSSCGICTQVCPQGVQIAEINTQAQGARARGATGVPLRDQLIARPTLVGRLGTPVAPIANWSLRNRPLRGRSWRRSSASTATRAMPRFAGRTFQGWARRHRPPSPRSAVVYFHGCGANYYEPRLGEMTVAVLEHNGFEVDRPQAGLLRAAAAVQRHLRRRARLRRGGSRGTSRRTRATGDTTIVGTSTSCTLMLKREAHEILGLDDEPDLAYVSERTYDICEFLLAPARPRRAAHRLRAGRHDGALPRALPAAGPRHRQAGARPDGARPRPARRRDATRAAAASPGRTA